MVNHVEFTIQYPTPPTLLNNGRDVRSVPFDFLVMCLFIFEIYTVLLGSTIYDA